MPCFFLIQKNKKILSTRQKILESVGATYVDTKKYFERKALEFTFPI